jgi:hypothetical protein
MLKNNNNNNQQQLLLVENHVLNHQQKVEKNHPLKVVKVIPQLKINQHQHHKKQL